MKPRWPHQEESVQFSARKPQVLDLSSPGTGKTRVYIDVFAQMVANDPTARMLVVCPSTLMEPAWGNDIRTFAPHLTVSYALAGKSRGVSRRELAFKADTNVVIINSSPDAMNWLAANQPLLADFKLLVIDELTQFKHRTSQRSKSLAKIRKHFPHRVGLTGTWVAKSVQEAWHQMLIIDDGKRLGTSFSRFRNQLCIPEDNGWGVEWKDKPNARELLSLLVRDITIRHKFSEVMTVPENRSYTRFIKLSSKARKAYDAMAKEALIELDKGDITAVNAAVLRNKLLQIASGAVYIDEKTYHMIDTFRYEFVADLIQERQHSVTFFVWRHQRDELIKQLDKREITHAYIDGTVPNAHRAEIVRQFQAGDYQTLLLQPETGAHGLTVTKATATIWCSPIYKPDFLEQGIYRIYRGGQTQETENIMVSAEDTIEDKIYEKLGNEHQDMLSLLELLTTDEREAA